MTTMMLDEAALATETTDRRRPGRLDNVSPQLLTLLRAEERAKLAPPVEARLSSDRLLDAGQGLILGLGIGALFWAAMIATGFAVFAA